MEAADPIALATPADHVAAPARLEVASPLVLLGGFVLSCSWILHTQLQRLYGLTAPGWDLGQTQQVLWSVAGGHGWMSSYEHGKDFLGLHVEPILLAVAAVEVVWPSPVVPLVFSAVGLAATGPAAYLLLRALFGEAPAARWLALALAAPMPFWAAIQDAGSDQFHPENMALALAMLAAWAGLRQKPKLMWSLVVATLCCKEDQTYTVFVIGLLVWRAGALPMKRHGLMAMALAAVWLVGAVGLLQQLSNGALTPGLAYYWWIWSGGNNFFLLAVTRPDAWLVLAGLLASLLALPLLAPRWMLLAVPPVAISLLSSHAPMERLSAHYVLIAVFPLTVAAGVGGRLWLAKHDPIARLPAPALLVGALPALAVGFFGGHLPPALGADPSLYEQPAAAQRLLAATSVIPAGAPLYADDGAVVWLSDRLQVSILYDHPSPDRYVVIDKDAWSHRGDPPGARAPTFAQLVTEGRRLLVDDGRFQVWSPADQI